MGPPKLKRLPRIAAEPHPDGTGRAPERSAAGADASRAGHSEMGVEDLIALEADEQVLAARLRPLDRPPAEALDPHSRVRVRG